MVIPTLPNTTLTNENGSKHSKEEMKKDEPTQTEKIVNLLPGVVEESILNDPQISKLLEIETVTSTDSPAENFALIDLDEKYGSLVEPSEGNVSRIQLKLVNGSSLQHNFKERVKLGWAINYFDKLCDGKFYMVSLETLKISPSYLFRHFLFY